MRTPFSIDMQVSKILYEDTVRAALAEDIGSGDITTLSTVQNSSATAFLIAKSPLVLCGLEVARAVFETVDSSIRISTPQLDGDKFQGDVERIAVIQGLARSILTAERVALNFLQRLSGVATITAKFVEAVAGTNARIVDTRKTTPGLRVLEKYAVRVGGGHNHRFGLSDGVLIKDNHIAAADGVTKAVLAARASAPHTMKIELEAKHLDQVEEALDAGADIILLDNMDLTTLRQAVAKINGRAITEASGGVNLTTVRAIAETGVDLISVGALTHSAPAVDISLDLSYELIP
jgi:nicotinate-nucleotide pyrophosphorylase (carboxylating)